jgi:hypothetical protein
VSNANWHDSDEERAAQDAIRTLDKEFRLAAYREKHSNFRHFDILRWQVPGIAFAVGGALLSFAPRAQNGLPIPAVLAVYGVFAVLCWYLMFRVGWNLRRNNVWLRRYSLTFGDDSIPPKPRFKGAAVYVELFLLFVGGASLLLAVSGQFGWWAVHLP